MDCHLVMKTYWNASQYSHCHYVTCFVHVLDALFRPTYKEVTQFYSISRQGRLSHQRQWRKLPHPLPFPSPFPPFPRVPSLPSGVWGQSPQWRGSGENGNWNRIWCILARFCFKTAAIQCFTFCEQKLNEFFPFQGVTPGKMEIEIGFGAFWRIFVSQR